MSPRCSHSSSPEFEVTELSPIRRAIAAKVTQSVREIPQFSIRVAIDASALVSARSGMKKEIGPAGVVPTFNDLLLYATARALVEHRALNAWLEGNSLKIGKSINVAFAVDTEQGVLLPVIRDADKKSLQEIASDTHELAELCQSGRIRASQQLGATFTISNLGAFGIDDFNAIISPPQVAILAIGAIKPRPFAAEGKLEIRDTVILTLTLDHRAVDGARGAAFLSSLAERLEDWEGGASAP